MQQQSVIFLEWTPPQLIPWLPSFLLLFSLLWLLLLVARPGDAMVKTAAQRLCSNQNSQRCQEAYPGEDMTRVRGTVPVPSIYQELPQWKHAYNGLAITTAEEGGDSMPFNFIMSVQKSIKRRERQGTMETRC